MGFRLALKWVTLNNLKWRNSPHFVLFHRIG